MAALLHTRADLLSAFLRQEMLTWGEKLTVSAIFWCVFSFTPLLIAFYLPLAGFSITNGQWMLMRRSAYFAVGGHRAVRDYPIDDIALGRRIIARRLRWRIADATEFVSCRMYGGFRQAVEGFTKNLFAVFGFRLLAYLFVWCWIAMLTFEPLGVILAYIILGQVQYFTLWLALVAMAQMVLLWCVFVIRLRFPWVLVFLYPLSLGVLIFIAFRSLWFTITGQATWKARQLPRPKVRLL